jgi:hypothetical protein
MLISRREMLLRSVAEGGRDLPRLHISFPGGRDKFDVRFEAPESLLRLIFEAAGYELVVERIGALSQRRQTAELLTGRLDVSLIGSGSSGLFAVLPMREPIRRGLLGLRLLLAPAELAPVLSQIRSQRELSRFRLGYGDDWSDLEQMRTLGFSVVTASSYAGLFRMLANQRFDWMHRGVNEVWAELDHPVLVPHGLVLVPGLALYYPLDDYFCVSPRRPDLLRLLQAGYLKLQHSGRYRQWFLEHYGRSLVRAGMHRRRVLQLSGYGVPPGTPLERFDAAQLSLTEAILQPP